MEEEKNVGEIIKKLRRNNNMTQQELAGKLNIKHQTIQKYEKGIIINIPIPTLKQIATIFNVSLYELLDPDTTFDFSDGPSCSITFWSSTIPLYPITYLLCLLMMLIPLQHLKYYFVFPQF